MTSLETETRSRLAGLWLTHGTANLRRVSELSTVADLRPTAMPIVIVGAGPSLTPAVPTLVALRGRAIVIAASHALAPLLVSGCRPDAVVVLDPQPQVGAQFDGLDCAGITLFVSPTVDPSFVSAPLSVATYFTAGPGERWIGQAIGAEHRAFLTTGGNVCGAALSIAAQWTTGPIAIVGVDLGFPAGRVYADGVSNAEDFGRLYLDSPFRVLAQDRTEICSTVAFGVALEFFQRQLLSEAGRVTNCSVGGAEMSGAAVPTLASWVRDLPIRAAAREEISFLPLHLEKRREELLSFLLQCARCLDATAALIASTPLEVQTTDGSELRSQVMQSLGPACDIAQLIVVEMPPRTDGGTVYDSIRDACLLAAPRIRHEVDTWDDGGA